MTIEVVKHLPQGVPDTVPRLSQLGVVISHLTPKVNPYDKLVVSNELEPSLVIKRLYGGAQSILCGSDERAIIGVHPI